MSYSKKHIYVGPFLYLFFLMVVVLFLGFAKRNLHFKEGFTWSPETEKQFALFQSTMNPRFFFDLSSVEQQASQGEVDVLLGSGSWPWEPITQQTFVDHVQTNTIVKTNPESTMQYARRIYNNRAAKQLLSWAEPEGHFLLSGAVVDSSNNHADDAWHNSYGYNSGLVSVNRDIIRCEKPRDQDPYRLQRTQNVGNDGITQVHSFLKTDVDYRDLPALVPGFSFRPQVGPCDPCVALNEDYSCPFSLSRGSNGISRIWKSLWGI